MLKKILCLVVGILMNCGYVQAPLNRNPETGVPQFDISLTKIQVGAVLRHAKLIASSKTEEEYALDPYIVAFNPALQMLNAVLAVEKDRNGDTEDFNEAVERIASMMTYEGAKADDEFATAAIDALVIILIFYNKFTADEAKMLLDDGKTQEEIEKQVKLLLIPLEVQFRALINSIV